MIWRKALVILALQALVLVAAVIVFVDSERKTTFPSNVAVPAVSQTSSVVPVSIKVGDGAAVGSIRTAVLSRGGKASAPVAGNGVSSTRP